MTHPVTKALTRVLPAVAVLAILAVTIPSVPPAVGLFIMVWGAVLGTLGTVGVYYIVDSLKSDSSTVRQTQSMSYSTNGDKNVDVSMKQTQSTSGPDQNTSMSYPTPEEVQQQYADGEISDEELDDELERAIMLNEEDANVK